MANNVELDTSMQQMAAANRRDMDAVVRSARINSTKRRQRKIEMVRDVVGVGLATIGAAAAIWFFMNCADILDKGIISERGGDPNIGYNGEYVGEPDENIEYYEENSSRGR